MNRSNFRILIVDDESSIILLLKRIIEDEGYRVATASNGKEALGVAGEFHPNLVLVDMNMPVMDGLTFIEKYSAIDPVCDFLVLTAYGTVESAVKAMKMGSLDYVTKPLKDPDVIRHAVLKAFRGRSLIAENEALKEALKEELFKGMPPAEIMFGGMEEVFASVRAVAPTNATVLITGETGTGKNLIARFIHDLSGRSDPFVEVNCAAMAETLIESELFGHDKGAFTGAIALKNGKFGQASGGTIFLDEITELDVQLQAKFLRILESGEYERVGGSVTMKNDARIICASNRPIKQEVAKGRFREDLFFRLNVFPVNVPPLRARHTHIMAIAAYLAESAGRRIGKGATKISPESYEKLTTYPWPGNVRELQNVIERAIILSRSDTIDFFGDISTDISVGISGEISAGTYGRPFAEQYSISSSAGSPGTSSVFGSIKEVEKKAIGDALKSSEGNRKKAAQILGISLRTLQYKIKEYGL